MSVDVPHRVGGWLPRDHLVLQAWLKEKIEYVDANPTPFAPVIQQFQQFIEGDAVMYMVFHEMFEQVPKKPPYLKDPTGMFKQVSSIY
jgi:phosphatidylserine decarboxylase